jgi:hypothetical protein
VPDDELKRTNEILTAIYSAIRQHDNLPAEPEGVPNAVSRCIERLARWYKDQAVPTDEDAAQAIELLELLVKSDFDGFFDELSDLMDGCDLPPLPRIPTMPGIFVDLSDDDEGFEEAR